jgi:pyruvate,water dikinase
MYCSAALVVEVGGALSHAAVVARELGVPCVMGVDGATARLKTGDVCRVDGHAGTVEILRTAG